MYSCKHIVQYRFASSEQWCKGSSPVSTLFFLYLSVCLSISAHQPPPRLHTHKRTPYPRLVSQQSNLTYKEQAITKNHICTFRICDMQIEEITQNRSPPRLICKKKKKATKCLEHTCLGHSHILFLVSAQLGTGTVDNWGSRLRYIDISTARWLVALSS